ncbi:MAG: ribbon-helix-helix domain-containing protein [Candidatus Aenigmatarchaeota archaeon]
MEVVQVRLPEKVVKKIDDLVGQGFYSSRSDFIRTKIRRILEEQIAGQNGQANGVMKMPVAEQRMLQLDKVR